jgi:hypothetical protein
MVFSGFELGSRIHTGARLLSGQDCPASVPANPCWRAFSDYSEKAMGNRTWRESWDSVTSLYAARGAGDYEFLQPGRNIVNSTDGSDVWSTASAGVRQSYLVLNETTGVAPLENAIDDLICRRPSSLRPQ